MVIAFGTLDKFQVQHIKFFTVGSGDLFKILAGEKLLTYVPDHRKIIKIQSHSIVKEKSSVMILDSGQRYVKLISFQSIDKLIHSRACCQSVQIELGMSAEKITVR